MPYITIPVKPQEYQISFDDILYGVSESVFNRHNENTYDTRTVFRVNTPKRLLENIKISELINELQSFNRKHSHLFEVPRATLYETFYLAKKGKGFPSIMREVFKCHDKKTGKTYESGTQVYDDVCEKFKELRNNHPCHLHNEIKLRVLSDIDTYLTERGFAVGIDKLEEFIKKNYRRIDAPKDQFKLVLTELKFLLEKKLYASYHTSAFAYVEKRSTILAVKRHQRNNSRWFLKLDFSNFFGNTTIDFMMSQLKTIFPFSEMLNIPEGQVAIEKAISLCFLNGGLPQGTPVSPMLTNLMMIPIDHAIAKLSRERTPHLCYTRYADDLIFSSDLSFKWSDFQQELIDLLKRFNAPFTLNTDKTRYGSSAGRNWNLGVMLNKDNQITIGHQKKKELKAALYTFIKDYKNNEPWSLSDVQVLNGQISYYKNVEKTPIEKIISDYSIKYDVDIDAVIKQILRQTI